MFSDQPAIQVGGLSKCYQLYHTPRDRLAQFVMPRARQLLGLAEKRYYREFWALRNVSFTVGRGETVGVVGKNGAGKSTLLQILCGTVAPTSGQVDVRGRVAALLELGSGFNPEFSGRENVFLNAAILGLTKKETESRFDEIVDFADIGSFIDQPVKTYSSGMYVRLAFAVSACVDPDVLIVDEALAVGDVKFQAKCFRRFEQLLARGTTILLVTHATEQVTRHCDRAILLDQGSLLLEGAPKDVVNRYLDLLFGVAADREPARNGSTAADVSDPAPIVRRAGTFETRRGYNPHEYRWGDGAAKIVDYLIICDGEEDPASLTSGKQTIVSIWVDFQAEALSPVFGLTIKTPDGVSVYGSNSRDFDGGPLSANAGAGQTKRIDFILDQHLGPGEYLISVGVADDRGGDIVPLDRRYDSIHVQVGRRSRSYGVADFHMDVVIHS